MSCEVCHGKLGKNAYGVCQRTRACKLEYMNRYNLKKYRMTMADFRALLEKQSGGCAICGTGEPGKGFHLHVDHNHQTGQVRGLLCNTCNRGIGLLRESPEVLRAAAHYLEQAQKPILKVA